MTALDSFAAMILTNGRPDRVATYDTLRKSGYTGRIVLVVDNLDPTVPEYIDRYGSEVIVFDKRAVAATFDQGDNFDDMRAIIYARNASFLIARQIGVRHFIQLDDDYTAFQFRFDGELNYRPKVLKCVDRVFAALVRFLDRSGASAVAMFQGGDFVGGPDGTNRACKQVFASRKAMNSFVCSTERPFQFVGRINEDVNTYTHVASMGALFLSTNQVNLNQLQTQSNAGGMTELYLDSGTYIKSFYSVMYHPSSVSIASMRGTSGSRRLHHNVSWRHTVPMIVRESLRKVT